MGEEEEEGAKRKGPGVELHTKIENMTSDMFIQIFFTPSLILSHLNHPINKSQDWLKLQLVLIW